ncbi:BglG family transcription antiterminator [Enterococcus sp. LJL99]
MKDRTAQIFIRFIHSNYPLTLSELGAEFNISDRTLRNEIKTINEWLLANELSELQTIRNRGMTLAVNEVEKKQLLQLLIERSDPDYLSREERIFDLILSFALAEEKIWLYQKEASYQISKSTMDEDMRRVRIILAEYGIEVLSIPKQGIVLKGTERVIRTMIYDVINKSIGLLNDWGNNVDDGNQMEKLLFTYLPKEIFQRIDSVYNQSVSTREDIYRNQLVLFTAVWLGRYLRQNIIAETTFHANHHETVQSEIRTFVVDLCSELALAPSATELNYLVFMLGTFNNRTRSHSIEWVQAQLVAIQMIQHVEKETKIPFSRKEEALHEGLYKHLLGLMNRMKGDIQIINPLKENVKQTYGAIYLAVERFSPVIECISKKELIEDEIAFLTIHFSTSVSEMKQEYSYVYKAVVVCNHGLATGKLLAENLKEQFPVEIIAVLSSGELSIIDKLDIDLIFSTLPIEYQTKPVLVLEPIIKEVNKKNIQAFLEDYAQLKRLVNQSNEATLFFHRVLKIIEESGGNVTNDIYQSVEQLFDERQLKINTKEIQPMLKDILKASDILLNETCTDWQEAIREVSVPLLKEQIIEPGYVEAMIASVKEFGPYIVIGKHLALAHARPEDGVNKLGISVATFAEPVSFGNTTNDPVKIIFCLAAVDSYSHLNIMKSLINLINDEEKIERLAECLSVQEFQTILYE